MRTAKTTVLFACLMLLTSSVFAQLKVLSGGNVGVANTNPSYKFDVTGATRLNGYVGVNGTPSCCYALKVTSNYGQTFMFDPSTAANGSILGSSTGKINFWNDVTQDYNRVYAKQYVTSSDLNIKRDIATLPDGQLLNIMKLRPVSYKYKSETDTYNDGKFSLGLIAQEVEEIIPEAISYSEVGGIRMIDYNMVIPVLIKALQEQQKQIEELTQDLENLKKTISSENSKGQTTDGGGEPVISEVATLSQNVPNPFTQNTHIDFYVPQNVLKANIYVYNMNGAQILNFPINTKGQGGITIKGNELTAGMFLYTLIIDGKEVDTRRMILTK